jgi:hypothetical protein
MAGRDAEGLLHDVLEAALVDEDEASAGFQFAGVDGHHHLGRDLPADPEGIQFVAAQPVLDDQGLVQGGGPEHRTCGPVRLPAVLIEHIQQIQDAGGRGGPPQVGQVADRAVGHRGPLKPFNEPRIDDQRLSFDRRPGCGVAPLASPPGVA